MPVEIFDEKKAVVRSSEGKQLCRFVRTPGGLCVPSLELKNPLVLHGRNTHLEFGLCDVLETAIFVC